MAAAKYDIIYRKLRGQIESHEYPAGATLPSEHRLVEMFGCSRNTVRRALRQLGEEGYVQSIHGKGVMVIYRQPTQPQFSIGGIESLKEAAQRNGLHLVTKVIHFEEVTVDEDLSARTGFAPGDVVYYLQRVRYLNGEALILDHNYFLKSVERDLTPAIAEESVYEYMEQVLGETIVTTRRKYTVEHENELDTAWLDLHGYNCLLVVSNQTFNKEGVLFEYTRSRHRPEQFVFYELAHRK